MEGKLRGRGSGAALSPAEVQGPKGELIALGGTMYSPRLALRVPNRLPGNAGIITARRKPTSSRLLIPTSRTIQRRSKLLRVVKPDSHLTRSLRLCQANGRARVVSHFEASGGFTPPSGEVNAVHSQCKTLRSRDFNGSNLAHLKGAGIAPCTYPFTQTICFRT